jgi:hypothetical protein
MTLMPLRRNLLVSIVAMLLVVIPLLPSQTVLRQLAPLSESPILLAASTPKSDNSLDEIPVMLDDQVLFLEFDRHHLANPPML